MQAEPPLVPPEAWQPFTFGGVAAFARASGLRVLTAALVAALLVTGCGLRFLYVAWRPALNEAVNHLPATGEIQEGHLRWPGQTVETLAETSFLAILVNPTENGTSGQSADVQLEFGRSRLLISSLFGYWSVPYPTGWIVALNRTEVAPRWSAWRPALLAGAAVAILAALPAVWCLLAALCCLPVRAYASLARRQANTPECWRLCVAALLAGGLLMGVAILLYAEHYLRLVDLLAVTAAHLVIDVAYLLGAPLCLPRRLDVSPFAAPLSAEPKTLADPRGRPGSSTPEDPPPTPSGPS